MSVEGRLEELEELEKQAQANIARATAAGDFERLPEYFAQSIMAMQEYLTLIDNIRAGR